MPSAMSAKLASMLLLQRGELARSDIAAFPWIEDDKEIDLIISIILRNMDATIQQRKIESSILPDWEDTIILTSKRRHKETH